MKQKKVLLSAYACNPSKGSENSNGWNWAKELCLLGFDVHIITTSEGKEFIEKESELNGLSKVNFHYVDHSPFWMKAYYWNFIFMYVAYLLWQYKIYKLAKKIHLVEKFDVVHHVTWGSVKIGSFLHKLSNTKFIFGPLGGGHKAPSNFKKYFYSDWKKELIRNKATDYIAFLNPLTKRTLSNAQVVLVTNSETLIFAKKHGAKSVEMVIDSALPTNLIRNTLPKRKKKKFTLLWLGRLYAFKGLGLVLDGFSKLDSETRQKIEFNIVGDGPFRDKFETILSELDLQKEIIYHGAIPYSEVDKKYLDADAFIFCSLRDSCPAQHLEAMSFGLPVITLNLHGSKLIVPDSAGIKVSVNDPTETVKEISDAIKLLLNDVELRLQMGKNAFEYAQKITWKNKVRDIVEKYY